MIKQLNNQDFPAANRTYKDGLFRLVFQKKEDLLSLYNAINGSNYSNPDELEINTLDNVLYLSMKNDLPFPQYIVFYNGTENEPDRSVLKLTDLFNMPSSPKTPCLECIAIMLNINYGHNMVLMEKCRRLKEYAIFVDTVRKELLTGSPLEESLSYAVDSCIDNDILQDILIKQKAEVIQMILETYDKELHDKTLRREGYEDGYNEGKSTGYLEGINDGIRQLISALQEVKIPRESTLRKLQEKYDLSQEEAEKYMAEYWKG